MAAPGANADSGLSQPAAVLAKGALRRLALARQEPTPENYARAYAEEAGEPPAAARARGPAWGALIERLARNLERGGKQWTAARRKESLHRVLDGSRSDEDRLALRLQALLQAWEADRPAEGAEVPASPGQAAPAPQASPVPQSASPAPAADGAALRLLQTLQVGLDETDARGKALASRLRARLDDCVAAQASATPVSEGALAQAGLAESCADAGRWFGQRHELVRQLTALCSEMSAGLVELAEDESWTRGQCERVREQIGADATVRGLREASAMLAETRARQGQVRQERQAAREAIKQMLAGMIGEVGALQHEAGGFESALARHADAVQAADSLEGLTGVVHSMLDESRRMRQSIGESQERLQRGRDEAGALEARVRELEGEMRRLSDEASTDALTQVSNRRGLEQAFATACARAVRESSVLAVGLIDIDNFKKLNDSLGHAAGDVALKTLAGEVSKRLRPDDHVARFGGEEFVVLLHGQPLAQAQQALSRLQRSLSASLFMHEGEEVFVTFSAGVTVWRTGEPLEAAVERADAGLYEAKRTGKNRTCSI